MSLETIDNMIKNEENIEENKNMIINQFQRRPSETSLLQNQNVRVHKTTELSPDCFTGADIAPSELLNDIIKVDMETILKDILEPRRSFFKILSVDKIMTWQKKEIDTPLLKMDDELKPIPIQMFRNLLSYMTDRKSSKKPISHARKFLKLTLYSEQIIKDEAYIQIFKQLHDNKSYDSLLRGWKFLAILASCFI